jgi:hypothetical protein
LFPLPGKKEAGKTLFGKAGKLEKAGTSRISKTFHLINLFTFLSLFQYVKILVSPHLSSHTFIQIFCCAKSGVARGSVFYSNQIFLQLEIAIHTTGDFKKSEIAMHTTGDFKKSPNSLEI